MKLKPTQKLLWQLITHPEGVAAALSDRKQKKLPLIPNRKLSEAERLDIYANMYFYRLLEGLESDYSALASYLGKRDFHNLITLYLKKFPPRHYSIRYAGQDLPLFLKQHPLYRRKIYLSELAALEWSILAAFDAYNIPFIQMSELTSLSPHLWPKLRLTTVDSVILLKTQYDVNLWRRNLVKSKTSPQKKKTHLLIWRENLKVMIREVDKDEFKALDALHQNVSLTQLSARLGAQKATHLLPKWLNFWVNTQILTSDNLSILKE